MRSYSKILVLLTVVFVIAYFLSRVSSILTPFITSIIVAYLLNPLTIKLKNYGMPRHYTIALILGFFVIILILAIINLVPALFEQLQQFVADMPQYKDYITEHIIAKVKAAISKIDAKIASDINKQLENIFNKFFEYMISIIANLLKSGMAIFNIIALFFLTPILVFYLLKDWPYFVQTFIKLLPKKSRRLIIYQLNKIDKVLSAYIRGQITVCLMFAAFYSIFLSMIGLNYSLFLGVMSGLLIFIPYLGLILSLCICSLVAFIQFANIEHVFITIIIFVVGNIFESYIITPKIIGEKIGLNPVWIIFSLMSGGALFGLLGVCIAIPVAAVLGVILRTIIKLYLRSNLYT
jgi:putative permease